MASAARAVISVGGGCGVVHGGGDGEAGDVVGALDPEAPVAAPRRRLHVAGLAEHPAQVVPGGGQRGDELEGVLGAGAAGDAPDADAAVLVRGEDPPARGRQRLEQLLAARRSSNAASASAWEPATAEAMMPGRRAGAPLRHHARCALPPRRRASSVWGPP